MRFVQKCPRCTKCAFMKHNTRRIPKIFIEDQRSVIYANGEGQGQVNLSGQYYIYIPQLIVYLIQNANTMYKSMHN